MSKTFGDIITDGDVLTTLTNNVSFALWDSSKSAGSRNQMILRDDLIKALIDARLYNLGIVPLSEMTVETSLDTDTDHDVLITPKSTNIPCCCDSTRTYNFTIPAAFTKQIDATWAAGDDAGGDFVTGGSPTADTTYYVFLIRKDSDGSIDAGFDTDIDCANIPSGYTAYRLIARVMTDGSSNIIPYVQDADNFYLETPVVAEDINPGTSAVLLSLQVPTGGGIIPIANYRLTPVSAEPTGATNGIFSSPLVSDIAPTSTIRNVEMGPASDGPSEFSGPLVANASGQIRVRVDNSGTNIKVMAAVSGWIDRRGRDG